MSVPHDSAERIWLAPMQWAWLALNLVWLNTFVPSTILATATLFRDPANGAAVRVGAAAVLIVGVPFVLVVGFGVVSHLVLERAARGVARVGWEEAMSSRRASRRGEDRDG